VITGKQEESRQQVEQLTGVREHRLELGFGDVSRIADLIRVEFEVDVEGAEKDVVD
jgi:hypothetical protein